MEKMEWCIENKITNELAMASSPLKGNRVIIFETEEEAQEMLKLTKDSFRAKAKICQKIIFGPKVDYKEVKEELKC